MSTALPAFIGGVVVGAALTAGSIFLLVYGAFADSSLCRSMPDDPIAEQFPEGEGR